MDGIDGTHMRKNLSGYRLRIFDPVVDMVESLRGRVEVGFGEAPELHHDGEFVDGKFELGGEEKARDRSLDALHARSEKSPPLPPLQPRRAVTTTAPPPPPPPLGKSILDRIGRLYRTQSSDDSGGHNSSNATSSGGRRLEHSESNVLASNSPLSWRHTRSYTDDMELTQLAGKRRASGGVTSGTSMERAGGAEEEKGESSSRKTSGEDPSGSEHEEQPLGGVMTTSHHIQTSSDVQLG